MEEHVAAALGNEGDASSPGLGRAGEGRLAAGDDKPTVIGPELAEENARQLELPAPHKAVDAEDFAGAHLERDVLEAAGERKSACLQHHRPIAQWRQRDVLRIALFERLAALADHGLDQGSLAGVGRLRLGDLPAVAENRHRVGDTQDVLDEMGNEDDAGAFIAQASQGRKQTLHLRRRKGGGRLVEDDNAGA